MTLPPSSDTRETAATEEGREETDGVMTKTVKDDKYERGKEDSGKQ